MEQHPNLQTSPWALDSILLVVAPLLMSVARILLLPMDDGDWDQTMTDMVANQARSDLGWVLAIAACGLLATGAAILARRLPLANRSRSAGFTLVTTAVGWAGCAAICLGGLVISEAGEATDRATMVQFQQDFNNGAVGWPYLLCVIGALGYIVLAIALGRSKTVSAAAAVLIGIGGVTTLLTMPGPITGVLVAAALLLTAGQSLAVRSPTTPNRATA